MEVSTIYQTNRPKVPATIAKSSQLGAIVTNTLSSQAKELLTWQQAS